MRKEFVYHAFLLALPVIVQHTVFPAKLVIYLKYSLEDVQDHVSLATFHS